MHTDQYLHWDSNHHITAKQSVYNTLAHRAKIVSSTQDKMDRELQHIRTALQHCQFPEWALNQWQHRFTHPNQPNTTTTNNNNNSSANSKKNITIVVPYMSNTGEKFRKLCKKKGIQVHFKGTNTLRTALGNPKDKDPQNNKIGIIYHYQCPHINCPSAYIGESGRSLGERVKEHFKAPSPIHLHSTTTGHPMDPEQFNIVHKRSTTIPGPSRKLCSSTCRTQPTIGTLVSTSYLTYGTTSFRHHLPFSASLPAIQLHPPPNNSPTYLLVPSTHSSHCPYWWGHILLW